MTPSFATSYVGNDGLRYAESKTYGCLRSGGYSYLPHRFISKLCIELLFAPFVAKFAYHILSVVFGRSQKQMTWVDAKSFVASVANQHAFRDFSAVDLETISVSKNCLTLPFALVKNAVATAITIIDGRTCPEPTTISLFDKLPKSLFRRSVNQACHGWEPIIHPLNMQWGL